MTYKLIIFDVDGTLCSTKSGATFRQAAEDWQLLPGRKEKLAELKAAGTRLAIASNQGGVAFGFLDQKQIMIELHKTARELAIPSGGVYICYNHPKATIEQYKHEDDRRKPMPGMLLDAMLDFEAQREDTLMVGDREEDEQAAAAAGIDFQWARDFFGEGKEDNG